LIKGFEYYQPLFG